MSTTRFRRFLPLAAGVLVLTACSGAGSLPEGAPLSDDVAGRDAVPTIKLVTKTQAEDPTRYEMARLIVDAWNAGGIDAELLPVGSTQLSSMTATSKDYDAYVISYDGLPERLDPDNLLARFTSVTATESGSNVSMYTNPDFDKAYEEQLTADSEEGRVAAVHHAQQILREDLPVAPLVHPEVGAAYRNDQWSGMEITASTPVFGTWNAIHAEPTGGDDELVVGTMTDPSALNPVLATQNQLLRPLQLIYDTVLTFDPAGDVVENAARSWESEGGQIRLSLDPDSTFSDGHPVRGEDVAFTIEYMKEHAAPLFAPALEIVDTVEANGSEVTINLSRPSASFPAAVLTNLPVLPEHVWSGYDDPSRATTSDLIGSGPFVLDSIKPSQSVVFARNDEFRQPPNVETLRMIVLGGFDAAAGALESDQIDMINQAETVASQYEQIEDVDGVEVVYAESHGWRGIHYNTTRPGLDDKAFREALTYLIPVDDLIQVAHQGKGSPASSVIAPQLDPWHDDSVAPIEYDIDAAMDALGDGGYVFDEDGTLYLPESDGN